MLTRSLACPSCGAGLRIPGNLSGKRVKCPKCSKGFVVPDEEEPIPAKTAVSRTRKAPPPPADDSEEAPSEKPARAPRKKPKKAASKTPVVLVVVIGLGVLLLGGGAVGAVIFLRPQKVEVVDNGKQFTPPPFIPGQGQGPDAGKGPPGTPGGKEGSPADGPVSAGRQVYDAKGCARCHSIGGGGGPAGGFGGGPGRGRKHDLSHIGANHDAGWIADHVRNPKAHQPNSKMPAFKDKIKDQDMRALADYLASLK
jgi:cytochrome c553